MANPAKLREQARAYELRDQWHAAIGTYHELLEASEGGDVDIGIWNRIGDLHLRLNETELAIQAYESAVSAYVEVGLYNNAIALCRKVLRLVPGRAQTYLRLGQISAAKGFFADARQNFLEYADRMRKAGKVDAAFDALKEFADLSPDPADVRRLLADQFLAHGRRDEAVEQLRLLLAPLVESGDREGADAVRQQILGIDPGASTEPLARAARAAAGDDFQQAFDSGGPGAPSAGAGGARADHVPTAPEEAAAPGEVAPIAGLESTMIGTGRGGAAAADDDEEVVGGDLPLIDPDAAPAPAADPARFGEVSLGQPLEFAPGAGDDEEEGEPLPLIDPGEEPVAPGRDRLPELRARVAAAPADHAARDELVHALHERGLSHEVPALLEEAHRDLAVRGQYLDAIQPLSALVRLRPGDPLLLQKRVEYAFKSGDRDAQVEAYLALGRHFTASGDRARGEAVFQRVLELDPQNPEARAAVPRQAPAAPAQPAAEYVDLGALILDDERETTTRFVVEEKEPSGDEDRDFAEMLAHFRQKVAENIEVEDVQSHYDLGLAFKEMGLVDEAIAEFQVALRGGANPLATLELLGQCFVEKGQYAVAARVLDRAYRLPHASDAELVGVLYQLGRVEEALGRPAQAIEYYERVLSVDIRFRDTARRIEALRAASGAAPL
ncbi:MAG TPA: tetratricopeptide repeat protein [Longimicrobium sp.]